MKNRSQALYCTEVILKTRGRLDTAFTWDGVDDQGFTMKCEVWNNYYPT